MAASEHERPAKVKVGVVGARGHTGRELMRIFVRHPRIEVAFVSSRTQAGEPVSSHLPGAPEGLCFEDLSAEDAAEKGADVVILALPNGLSAPYVAAVDARLPRTAIVDLSADHRFDDTWAYGLPEINRAALSGARRIANPGCYATAMALVVKPVAGLFDAPAHSFGVSGYSGAGTTPSPRNDVEALRDNLMPYQLTGHVHEREVRRHAGPVRFVPHVAQFFRGISMTVAMSFAKPLSRGELMAIYETAYGREPLVRVTQEIPEIRAVADTPYAALGGFTVDESERRAVVVSTLDNLLKGAASQAVQNINLAFGLPEEMGLDPWET